MTHIPKFIEQRRAFEKAYKDGDWGALELFLEEEITYEVMNMPFHCVIKGRGAVIAGWKKSVEGFDKHCSRTIGHGSKIFEEGCNVLVHGDMRFQRGDSPVLESSLWEIATYRDGRITRMLDIYDAGDAAKFRDWLAKWGAGLDASYA